MANLIALFLELISPWWKPAQPAKPVPPKPSILPYPTAPATTSFIAEIVRIHNANRDPTSPLELNSLLTKAAQKHADWMASKRTMSHRGEGFSSPGAMIKLAGYDWNTYGENVAYGQKTPEQVMRVWLGSPGHRRNIKNSAYHEIGIGYATGSNGAIYWCVTFGARGFSGVNQWDEAECCPDFAGES